MLQRGFPWVIFAFVLLFLVLNPLKESSFGTASDEGYYYRYALQISEQGVGGVKSQVQWYADNIEARLHPAPSRVGYTGILAVLFKIFGPGYALMGGVSTISFFLFIGGNIYFLRRYFTEASVSFMSLFLVTSPLLMGLSRRALVDIPVCLFWSVAFWSLLEYIRTRAHRHLVLFAGSLTFGILFKESTVLLFPVFLCLAFLLKIFYKKAIDLFAISGALFAAGIGALIILFLMLGDMTTLMTAIGSIVSTHTQVSALSSYAVHFSSGPWYRYLTDFFLLSPVVMMLAVGYAFLIFVRGKTVWHETALLLFFIGTYTMFNLFPHSKVIRFVAILEMVFAVFAVRGIEEIFKEKTFKMAEYGPFVLTSVLALMNSATFWLIFYRYGLLDPITKHLASILGFMPL